MDICFVSGSGAFSGSALDIGFVAVRTGSMLRVLLNCLRSSSGISITTWGALLNAVPLDSSFQNDFELITAVFVGCEMIILIALLRVTAFLPTGPSIELRVASEIINPTVAKLNNSNTIQIRRNLIAMFKNAQPFATIGLK